MQQSDMNSEQQAAHDRLLEWARDKIARGAVESCPSCNAEGPFEQTTIGHLDSTPDPNWRICTCGHRWQTAEYLAYEAERERKDAEARAAVACAGAPFVTETCAEGVILYSKPSGPTLRGIPNVSILLTPDGQCGVVTEKDVTCAMKAAIEDAAIAASEGIEAWTDEALAILHAKVVMWLRRQWTIGRIRRAADGTWDLLPAVSPA
jgi:hypothetical protein